MHPIVVHEPTRLLSEGEYEGFHWIVLHNRHGVRCGYIRIPAGHPWHGQPHEEIDADVHGGLTYGEPEAKDGGWWYGFDCIHQGDRPDLSLPIEPDHRSKMMEIASLRLSECDVDLHVWTQAEVEAECLSLCNQASQARSVVRIPRREL